MNSNSYTRLSVFVFCFWIGLIFLSGNTYASSQIGVVAGYRSIFVQYKYDHKTHPDDDFLSGGAGTTEIDQNTHWAHFAIRYKKLFHNLNFQLDLGFLVGGGSGQDGYADRKQNENDTRPPAEGAFIYSRIPYWGLSGATALTLHLERIELGIEAQLSSLLIENGWDRFSSDEVSKREFIIIPSIGPKFGVFVNRHLGIEATMQAAEEGLSTSVNLFLNF